jgi:hypothetical protein
MVALPAGFQEEGKMTKMRLNTIVRIMAGVLLGLAMATIWMGSHPGPAYAQCGGTITVGSTLRGDISRRGTSCSYYFDGWAGNLVTIRMSRVSTSLSPYWELYSPQNRRVASGNGSLISYSVPSTGRYQIRARSNNNSTGVFDISLGQIGYVSNRLSGKCIDVQGAPATANGAALQLWDCEFSGKGPNNSPTDQKWELTGDGFIRNKLSGKCIDVQGAPATANGALLQLWDCEFSGRGPNNSSTDQRWLVQ